MADLRKLVELRNAAHAALLEQPSEATARAYADAWAAEHLALSGSEISKTHAKAVEGFLARADAVAKEAAKAETIVETPQWAGRVGVSRAPAR